MSATLIKICGLREPQHALVAAEAGADYLGMVFVPGVRRRITVEQARQIVQAARHARGTHAPKLVGLFQDQPLSEVNEVAAEVGLDHVQLCGHEPMDYCGKVAVSPFKVLHVRADVVRDKTIADMDARLADLNAAGWLAVLDKHSDRQGGGTGETFDWSIAAELAQRGRRFLLAGGLTPANVAEAVRTVHPHGVDVSSGVETDGVKDIAKIRAFVVSARSVKTL
jgi:phosphoribosylanthranilate isomerase